MSNIHDSAEVIECYGDEGEFKSIYADVYQKVVKICADNDVDLNGLVFEQYVKFEALEVICYEGENDYLCIEFRDGQLAAFELN